MRQDQTQNRKILAQWLRDQRIKAGKTQLEIAQALGLDYVSTVTGYEVGRGRVPAARYADYARALRMDPKDFVRELLKHYDPEAWKILFGPEPPSRAAR